MRCGDQHALAAVQPGRFADAEITLDLFVDPAHRQHFAVLIDRAGDGDALPERQTRQRREQRIKFGAGSRISFDAVVFLLEHDGCIERERRVMGEQRGQVVLQDEHALVVDRAGHLHLALDVEQAVLAGVGARRDAHRKAETVIAQIDLGQAVELADLLAMQVISTSPSAMDSRRRWSG